MSARTSRWELAALACVALLLGRGVIGCEQAPPKTRYLSDGEAGREETAPPEKRPIDVAGLRFTAPEPWRRVEPNGRMRAAQFTVPSEAPEVESAEVVLFHFGPGQGGGVEDNLARWARRVLDDRGEPVIPEIERFDLDGLSAVTGYYEGEYQRGMPGEEKTPKPGWALFGGVIQGGANGPVFFRMTGPRDIVRAERETCEAFIRGAREAGGAESDGE